MGEVEPKVAKVCGPRPNFNSSQKKKKEYGVVMSSEKNVVVKESINSSTTLIPLVVYSPQDVAPEHKVKVLCLEDLVNDAVGEHLQVVASPSMIRPANMIKKNTVSLEGGAGLGHKSSGATTITTTQLSPGCTSTHPSVMGPVLTHHEP
jgi:hypothetical protein